MSRHVILGKGPIGRTLAGLLATTGHDVLVLSRSGAPTPAHRRAGRSTGPGTITHAAIDGTDGRALTASAAGAEALYNCVNPPYHRWATDWPPVAEALLQAAEATGAPLVIAGNLYSYGAGTYPMREDSPLASTETKGVVRAAMWREAQARHRAGRLRATEVRGSDYLGPEAEQHAHAGPRMLDPLLAGRRLAPIGSADQPHSWTYLPDFACALASAATEPAAWGHAWHAPTPEPLTYRELATRFAEAAGAPRPRIAPVPMWLVRLIGVGQPMLREIHRIGYQFTEPFVLDSTRSQQVLGLAPTPWPTIIAETLAAR
ncbi:NAD-dependent epimerase/dehydratase family protein [Cellulomonas sp. KRMCY2]|uniref:NAD-dependent epimerase/dehydratase family protein n=1 Tax=Cellulomonas sp. KRMCY2 TaxID=1304865 RepID=UPI00045E7958|nr:NAD-dependent epimerase/dehydratase family protein [Cellulomonas sp. KRMCY2]